MGNSPVDKGQSFIDEGMTLITETDADKYLELAASVIGTKGRKNYILCQRTAPSAPAGVLEGLMTL